ncbi:MAG: exodeoxyribonuclease VII large subunit [Mariniblastus sp.]|nr:exodeoxyribonuclease VII large subunit [Mariniblastus sp.]
MARKMENPEFLTVSELTDGIKESLNAEYPDLWVKAEISEITQAASGHYYLTLKDEHAQLAAIIWRSNAAKIRFSPEKGQEILCRGYLDVYPQRGTYQLIIQQLQPVGQGALQLAFRQLHERLKSEGLFDPQFKRPIPGFPQRVAVVTSPRGAAVHDFLQVIQRRWPILNVTIVPTKVQGPGAADQIAEAIRLCSRLPGPSFDVVVVTRGGGSAEDLWSFNEEVVCRAIHECTIPVISAVGHEVDLTLSDLVADMRALTPTEAGERIVPNLSDIRGQIRGFRDQMDRHAEQLIGSLHQQLENLSSRPVLTRPLQAVHHHQSEVDRLADQLVTVLPERLVQTRHLLKEHRSRLYRSIHAVLPVARLRLSELAEHPALREPTRITRTRREHLSTLAQRLDAARLERLREIRNKLETETARLEAYNPLAVLSRGFSLTTNLKNVPITDCQNVAVGDKIQTRLDRGQLVSRVEEIKSK